MKTKIFLFLIIIATMSAQAVVTKSTSNSSYQIFHDGQIIDDGDVINVDLADISEGEQAMKFNYRFIPNVDLSLVMKRRVITAAEGQRNEMCLGYCHGPEVDETDPYALSEDEEAEIGSTYASCYQPIGSGVTTILYTFAVTERGGSYSELNVTVNFHASAFYLVANNGSTLELSGTWTAQDFKNIDISTAELTSIDMTSISIPADAPELEPDNSNCLIYTAADANVPSSWPNVVKGDKADSIYLYAGNNYTNIKAFTAKLITVNYDFPYITLGTKAMMVLPFNYTSEKAGVEAEEYIFFTGKSVEFKYVNEINALSPYLVKPILMESKKYSAENVVMPITTPFVTTEPGMIVSWTKRSKDIIGLYTLSANGTAFERIGPNTPIEAWSVVLKLPAGNTQNSYQIINDSPSGVKDVLATDGLSIVSKGGVVTLYSDKNCDVDVVSVDGRIVRRVKVEQGSTEIHGLASGIYLINKQKVSVSK